MSERGRITRFGLRNFKAFRYLEDIEIRPLTVLVGANSTGKSSILQSLLLLKQTSLAGRGEGALKFGGELVQLGNFSTVISDFDTSRDLEYRFTFETVSPPLLRAEFALVFGLVDHPDVPTIKELSLSSTTGNNAVRLRVRGNIIEEYTPEGPQAEQRVADAGARVFFNRFWPDSFQPGKYDVAFPYLVSLPVLFVRELLEERLEYLGPVRADPRPFYPVTEEPDIGPRGEGTIPYLLRHQRDAVHYRLSHAEAPREATLLEALNDWLRALDITPHLTIDPLESIAFTAAIRSPAVKSRAVNLAQVGFGISQILPVLVMGLKGPDDAFLLYEQPEIHLHPRLQAGLADFFLASARSGKTILLETHSDHLVNRLRRRIAEDETGELSKLVQILFVHAGTEDDPGSYIEPLTIDETGTVLNAPPDFFPEAADEAFALLAARKHKAGPKTP